jgi:glycosidase
MRAHPHLYQINTWPWLDELSRRAGHHLTLGGVPDRAWDHLQLCGIDIVYLMGIWKRSALGRQLARSEPSLFGAFDQALPDWMARDVAGSAYCISAYEPDPRIGSWEDLADIRVKLHARGMKLMVDFIPNHTGFDHPWILSHPDRYVQGDESVFRRNPRAFRPIEISQDEVRFIACGRDPYFAPWTDVAQLDYSNADTRAAMIDVLERLATRADGARCDMAMLVLSEIFSRTWGDYLRTPMTLTPAREFWADARAAVPQFTLLAEVYWDLEWRLQHLGFDFTYDKGLYDRLLHSSPADVLGHLTADADYQRRSARFIENHDEPRSAAVFGDRVRAAAVVVSTLPGLRFFHQGQFEGRMERLPVQLGRWSDEAPNEGLLRFYARLLGTVNDDVFHVGEWRLLDVRPAGDGSNGDLLAWRWLRADETRLVVVNLGGGTSQGLVQLSSEVPGDPGDETIVFEDQLDGQQYPWSRRALNQSGLYVKLGRGAAHIFRIVN